MTDPHTGKPHCPPASFRRWPALLLGICCIALFLFVVAPAARDHLGIADAAAAIQRRDIEAGEYFYTGVEQVGDAELFIRHSREYPVRFRGEPTEVYPGGRRRP